MGEAIRYQVWPWQEALAKKYSSYYDLELYQAIDMVDAYGRTRLMNATNLDEAQQLLKRGANPHLQQIYAQGIDIRIRYAGRNALIAALASGDVPHVQCLLEARVDPNQAVMYTDPGMGSFTVLPADYSDLCSEEMMELLCRYGMNPDRKGEWHAHARRNQQCVPA